MRLNLLLALVAVGLISLGCSGYGTFLPVAQESKGSPIPAQELLLAAAADKATENITFTEQVKGKSVYVDVVGVLPHSTEGLTQYLAANLEESLAGAGAKIMQKSMNKDVNGNAYATSPDADYRVVVYVRAGGVDFKTVASVPVLVINYQEIAISRVDLKVVAFDLRNGGTGSIGTQTGTGSKEEILINQFQLGSLKIPFGTEYIGKAQEKNEGGVSGFLKGLGL